VNAEAIISFDKHFDNLKIPRKEPKDIVNLKMQNSSKPTTTRNPTHYAERRSAVNLPIAPSRASQGISGGVDQLR
jgi:hypothetical protein